MCLCDKRLSYLIFDKKIQHVVCQLPLWTVFNRKFQHLCFDFGLLGLWRLVRLLLSFSFLCVSLKMNENKWGKVTLDGHSAYLKWTEVNKKTFFFIANSFSYQPLIPFPLVVLIWKIWSNTSSILIHRKSQVPHLHLFWCFLLCFFGTITLSFLFLLIGLHLVLWGTHT